MRLSYAHVFDILLESIIASSLRLEIESERIRSRARAPWRPRTKTSSPMATDRSRVSSIDRYRRVRSNGYAPSRAITSTSPNVARRRANRTSPLHDPSGTRRSSANSSNCSPTAVRLKCSMKSHCYRRRRSAPIEPRSIPVYYRWTKSTIRSRARRRRAPRDRARPCLPYPNSQRLTSSSTPVSNAQRWMRASTCVTLRQQ